MQHEHTSAPRAAASYRQAPIRTCCQIERLMGRRCAACGPFRWPPREHCASCHTAAPQWVEAPGAGTVVGFDVVHRVPLPASATDTPYALATSVWTTPQEKWCRSRACGAASGRTWR
ncbi:zinc ribbon domain-containing protein [Streptomyces carpinensis]|uniref:Zinc ribbon domain-containing protein n=1 Tax=Streptomyces carpinensis TaxID=66369 RepID=A0ABV1VZU2_9ACTN